MIKQRESSHSVRDRKQRLKREKTVKRVIGAFILLILLIIAFQTTVAALKSRNILITVEAKSVSIKQGEEMPTFQTKVSSEAKEKKMHKKKLDKKSGYTVWDLMQDLKQGKGYEIACKADGTKEGKFPIQLQLSKEIEQQLAKKWKGKVTIKLTDGDLTVLNKVGEWDKEKFRRWDGTYVENDFVTVKERTYYFGEDGRKVSGWKQIGASYYFFDEKGIMQKDQWKKKGESKAYLLSDGKAALGWMELDEKTYYFNQEGEMATGKQRIGSSVCVFDEEGALESKKSKIDPAQPMMALTFDDGPGDRTAELIAALEKYNAHATFFMQGINIPGHEDVISKMVEAGCELGNHSYNHPELPKLSDADMRAQIGDTNNLIEKACGQTATVMRPPYGAINDALKKNVGMPMILWNIDTLDWKTKDANAVVNNVLQTADDGDIVLLHDIHGSSVDAALTLIPKLVDAGYQLVTVSEMAEARGIHMESGGVYTDFNK